jgi:hypothetical protein
VGQCGVPVTLHEDGKVPGGSEAPSAQTEEDPVPGEKQEAAGNQSPAL